MKKTLNISKHSVWATKRGTPNSKFEWQKLSGIMAFNKTLKYVPGLKGPYTGCLRRAPLSFALDHTQTEWSLI